MLGDLRLELCLVRRIDHHGRDHAVGFGPRLIRLVIPGVTRDVGERVEQYRTDRLIERRLRSVLDVTAPQLRRCATSLRRAQRGNDGG